MHEIEMLRKIVKTLPNYNPGVIDGDTLILDTLSGSGKAIGLCNCEKIAIANTVLSEETVLDAHYHPEKEIVILYEGLLRIWINVTSIEDTQEDTFVELQAGDIYIIEPNTSHIVETIEGCRFIVITIPASKGFPNGRN